MTFGLLIDSVLLALLLVMVYWRAPKCPNCSCLRSQGQQRFGNVRTCAHCQTVYKIGGY